MGSLDHRTRTELGSLLRHLRQRERLTLAVLAPRVGVTESALSQFENGKAEPSLGTLWALGRELNASLFDFFARHETENVEVTRPEERTVVIRDRLRYEAIVRSARRRLDMFYMVLQPGEGEVRKPMSHAGDEAGVVISGSMDVVVDQKSYRLNSGDGIWFLSDQPHSFITVGTSECTSVWADTVPDQIEPVKLGSLFTVTRSPNTPKNSSNS